MRTAAVPSTRRLSRRILPPLLIVLATLAAYGPLHENLFVAYDDPEYITDNAQVLRGLSWEGVAWAFTGIHERNWHPLTWISHMIDVTLFGLDPAGHHLVSLGLHLANALLLFAILKALTGARWRSVAVALLFSVHPLRVESVAWAAERKDLLCALFFLLAILAYHGYVRRPGWRRALAVGCAFAAGLFAKPMILTLPFVLLLIDCWPLGRMLSPGGIRLRSAFAEKLPLLLLGAVAGVVAYQAQTRSTGVPAFGLPPLGANISNALQSCVAYLDATVWPAGLAAAYPYFSAELTLPRALAAALVLLAVTAVALRVRRRCPAVATGWLWYLCVLAPVSGFVRIGYMARADRYTYLPQIGLLILACWGGAGVLAATPRLRPALAGGALAVVTLLAGATYRQVQYWHDGIALMERAAAVTDGNWFAYNSLCSNYVLLATRNRSVNIGASLPPSPTDPAVRRSLLRRAQEFCTLSVRYNSTFPLPHYNLGVIALRLDDRPAAIAEYDALLRLKSDHALRLEALLR